MNASLFAVCVAAALALVAFCVATTALFMAINGRVGPSGKNGLMGPPGPPGMNGPMPSDDVIARVLRDFPDIMRRAVHAQVEDAIGEAAGLMQRPALAAWIEETYGLTSIQPAHETAFADVPRGTMECPICGLATTHTHTGEEVARWRGAK